MNASAEILEFGQRIAGQVYVPRPGAYALVFDDAGRIAVFETPRGCYLPGGGTEGEESPEETLVREVREECGFAVSILGRVGEAVEYVYTAGNESGIRKECAFFAASFGAPNGTATEPDHTLLWLKLAEAEKRLAHGSQRWAVSQAIQSKKPLTKENLPGR